jgi:CBS domain-containing protein
MISQPGIAMLLPRQALTGQGDSAMKAGDVMTMGAATVRPDSTLAQAAQLLIEHRISGLPVVDEDGRLIGLVTEHDFLRQHDGTRRRWLDALLAEPGGQLTARELYDRRVVNVMSRGPVSVRVDTPIEEIVDLMHRHRVKRLPVVAEGKVVGIVSRADVLEALLGRHARGRRT